MAKLNDNYGYIFPTNDDIIKMKKKSDEFDSLREQIELLASNPTASLEDIGLNVLMSLGIYRSNTQTKQ